MCLNTNTEEHTAESVLSEIPQNSIGLIEICIEWMFREHDLKWQALTLVVHVKDRTHLGNAMQKSPGQVFLIFVAVIGKRGPDEAFYSLSFFYTLFHKFLSPFFSEVHLFFLPVAPSTLPFAYTLELLIGTRESKDSRVRAGLWNWEASLLESGTHPPTTGTHESKVGKSRSPKR